MGGRQRVELSPGMWGEIAAFMVLLAVQLLVRATIGVGWVYILCMAVAMAVAVHLLIRIVRNVQQRPQG